MAERGEKIFVTKDASKDGEVESVEVPIDFVISDGFGLLYSDYAFVQSTADEFIISFFQGAHPLVKSREEAEKLEAIRAYCVARIVLSPAQMRKLRTALLSNLDKHERIYGKKEEAE